MQKNVLLQLNIFRYFCYWKQVGSVQIFLQLDKYGRTTSISRSTNIIIALRDALRYFHVGRWPFKSKNRDLYETTLMLYKHFGFIYNTPTTDFTVTFLLNRRNILPKKSQQKFQINKLWFICYMSCSAVNHAILKKSFNSHLCIHTNFNMDSRPFFLCLLITVQLPY